MNKKPSKIETRGGPRPGAGRKKGSTKDGNKKSITVRLAPDIVDFLKAMSKPGSTSQADLIETAVRGYFGEKINKKTDND